MSGRRPTRLAVARAVLGLVAAGGLLGTGPASAQSSGTPTLGGYQGVAQADGLHAFYNPEGVLPLGAPGDVGAPDAYATIATGPATFARASAADPGDIVANPDVLLQVGAGASYKPGTIPAYPYRATASSAGRPVDESSPAPGLLARTTADESGSVAVSTMPGTATPSVATFGSLSSTATTSTDGATVTVHARSELSDLNVLGLLKIGSVVTDVTATSDGSAVQLSGGTVVSGGSMLGTPVDIDANGVRAAPGTTTTTNVLSGLLGGVLTPSFGSLNDLLQTAGIHVTVAGPVQNGTEKAGLLQAGGLRIELELSDRTFPVLGQLLDAVPEVPALAPGAPGLGDVIALAGARHLVAIQVGRGVVSLSATAAKPFTLATPLSPSTGASTGSSPIAASSPVVGSRPGATSSPSLIDAAPAPAVIDDVPAAASVGAGVGAMALLVLLAQPFAGSWLARGSASLLASNSASSCPWEGR